VAIEVASKPFRDRFSKPEEEKPPRAGGGFFFYLNGQSLASLEMPAAL
jgi:hypothetical protein